MKKSILFYALAASMTVLAGCQVEPVQQEEPAKVGTHKVSFTVDQSETKTVMSIEDGKSYFTWDDGDVASVKVYENGVEADPEWMDVTLSSDRKVLSVVALFDDVDPAPASYRYDACINSEVPAAQTTQATTYDRRGDVIYAEPITRNASVEDADLVFNFKRAVAISKMTLRGIGDGETIQSVVVKSTEQPLTGTFVLDMENGSQPTWSETGTELTITGENLVADGSGNCVVYFTTLPISAETLTVDVVTNASSYTKTFGPITITTEKVKSYGVTVAKKETEHEETHTIVWPNGQTDWSGIESEIIELDNDYQYNHGYEVIVAKTSSSTTPPTVNATSGDLRAYAANSLVISHENPITRLVFNLSAQGLKRLALITANVGEIAEQQSGDNTVVWTGRANSITFEVGPKAVFGSDGETKAGQFCFTSIDATYIVSGDAPDPIAVESVALDKSTLDLRVGETGSIVATVSPDNATNKAVTWESNNTSVATVANGVVTAVAPGEVTITVRTVDGEKTATCAVTVTSNIKTLTSIQEINDEAMAAGSEKRDVYIKFDNWIVSGVNSSRAYVTDNEKGFVMYTKDHGFVAGDVLSGTVLCKVNKFELVASVEGVTKDNITVTKGGVVIPKYIATKNLAPVYTGVVVTYSGMVYDETTETLSKGEDVIVTNNTLYPGASFVDGHTYNVTGVYLRYLKKSGTETDPVTTPENDILPRSAADIVDLAPVKYNVTVQTVQNGSVTANPTTAAEGAVVTLTATPDSGYEFESWNVTNASTSASITVTDNKFTMPAADVNVSATFKEVSSEGTKTLVVDFEKATDQYADWVFTNITTQQTDVNVAAHGGSYFGTTGGKQTGSVQTKDKVEPKSITFYISKTTTNTTSSSWKVQTSSNGSTWNDAKTVSASSVTRGTWTEVTNTFAGSLKDVYVRVYYTGTTAVRTIDDIALVVAGSGTPDPEPQPVDATWSVGPSSVTVEAGKTATATISTNYDGTLSVSSSATSIATATISGKVITVTGVSKGSTTLTVTGSSTSGYNAINKTINVTVNEAQGGGTPSPSDPVTATTTINDVVSENNYTVSSGSTINTKCTSIDLDDIIKVSVSVKEGATGNTGTFWGTTSVDWRHYQTDEPTITVSAKEGYSIVSVKFTYTNSNTGVLNTSGFGQSISSTYQITSGKAYDVDDSSVTYYVGNTSTKANGQVRITAIEVVYKQN